MSELDVFFVRSPSQYSREKVTVYQALVPFRFPQIATSTLPIENRLIGSLFVIPSHLLFFGVMLSFREPAFCRSALLLLPPDVFPPGVLGDGSLCVSVPSETENVLTPMSITDDRICLSVA